MTTSGLEPIACCFRRGPQRLANIAAGLLFDRDDVDFITAMITSVRAAITSLVPMLGWALAIVVVLVVSMLPLFLGLLVTLPVLGHASWHLYRRVVADMPQPDAKLPPLGLPP